MRRWGTHELVEIASQAYYGATGHSPDEEAHELIVKWAARRAGSNLTSSMLAGEFLSTSLALGEIEPGELKLEKYRVVGRGE